ncbi:MAG: MotA/TolQ/ExbB proton channel family protein [Oscillospiraceae bacterium]|nr:MotA/TolQ/ExbB proton channel family protein [Oscillospiraceae bacterium]
MPEFITVMIVLLFAFNIAVFYFNLRTIKKLESIVRPKTDRRVGIAAELRMSDEESRTLLNCAGKASGVYALFTNITAVFPLLGILGTVASLMRLSGTDDLSENFSSALITTFAGLVAAIIFKIMDSFITARLDSALDEADYLIHEHDKEKREQ